MSKNNTLRHGELSRNPLSNLDSGLRRQAIQCLAKAKKQEEKKKGSYQLIDDRTRVFVEDKEGRAVV